MKAMVLTRLCNLDYIHDPLELQEVPPPELGDDEILVRVSACGVCHTEIDEIEGRTPPPHLPVIPGHQVVGTVAMAGSQTVLYQPGERVGIAWIYSTCGRCKYCLSGKENLCSHYQATGRDANGGYAEFIRVQEKFAYLIPPVFSDVEAAPMLCAGTIGYRSLRLCGLVDGQPLGLVGFGSAAHIVLKLVKHLYPNTRVYVYSSMPNERTYSLELGADWSGDITEQSPEQPDAIIDTTPTWKPVVEAMAHLAPGGRLVINAIRKEEQDKEQLLQIDYPTHLWLEKEITSVANVTRDDVETFLCLAAEIPIKPDVQEYSLEDANQALVDLKNRRIRGAKVLRVN